MLPPLPLKSANIAEKRGFTLIELSIVLVIIGLVIGGILVGNDLIKASEVRKSVSMLESYSTAVNTFKLKYNCLPGDCGSASSFGFTTVAAAGVNGDGDDRIFGYSGISTPNGGNGSGLEVYNFWLHLGQAVLIQPMKCTNSGITGCNPPSAINYILTDYYNPRLPIMIPNPTWNAAYGGSGGVAIMNLQAFDYTNAGAASSAYVLPWFHAFYLAAVTYKNNPVLSSISALALDTKMDDGLPLSGGVRASGVHGGSPVVFAAPYSGCTQTVGGVVIYDLSSGNTATCVQMIKAAF